MILLRDAKSASVAAASVVVFATAAVGCGWTETTTSANGGIWPTLHRDCQRSGYTDEMVKGPYERKWYRDFHDEMIATRVEAIVAEGKCFIGTFAGNLYALDVKDGKTMWKFQAGGPIGHSPCYEEGTLYFGADEGFKEGHLYRLRADDGSLIWKYNASAGIWVSPACDGEKVYFGDRAGVFHAVNVDNGERAWTFETGNMILTPASFSHDKQRIVLGSEDMHVYCLDRSGNLMWRSKKPQGLSLRDHAPTIWRGLVIVRTNPADGFHTVLNRNGELLKRIQQSIPLGAEDKVLFDKWNDILMKETPRRRKAEQEGVVNYLKENPHDQTFYALRLEDGKEAWTAPILYTCGLHNPATQPTFNPETGELYVYHRTALTNYLRGVRRYSALGRLNRETGLIDLSWPEVRHPREDWYGFPLIGDETQSLSMMGNMVISTHQGELSGLDLNTERTTHIWRGRDTYGGIFGPGAVKGSFEGAQRLAAQGYLTGMPNEWHGPDRAIVAIAQGRMFWVVGSQVVCIGGPEVPKTESGGTKPPAIARNRLTLVGGGNVTWGRGSYDETLQKIAVEADDVLALVNTLPPTQLEHATTPLAVKLRTLVDAEVTELVENGPWAPFVVELGIVNEQAYFWRTAETMQILSQALPHLSPPTRARAKAHLDEMFASGMPLSEPVYTDIGAKRREHYELGPGMKNFADRRVRYRAGVQDVYALWAYAHYSGTWDKVLSREREMQAVFAEFAGTPVRFDHNDNQNDSAERLNAQIAGILAIARIMQKAGKKDEEQRAITLLAELLTERVHHERADSRLIRRSGMNHNSKAPRYAELVPETCAILCTLAGEKFRYHVLGLARQLPVWYQAFGERMIGGENYISPPHLARGLFVALADGLRVEPDELAKYLDQPWCRADLYYIEKITAVLRRIDGAK